MKLEPDDPEGHREHVRAMRSAENGEGDKWVDISPSQLKAIQDEAIEKCAAALDHEATYNDIVAKDERDFLGNRFNAMQNAGIKRYCAAFLRTTKSK